MKSDRLAGKDSMAWQVREQMEIACTNGVRVSHRNTILIEERIIPFF